MNNQKENQNPSEQTLGTDVPVDVSRETSKKTDIYEKEKKKKADLDIVRKKGNLTDDDPFDNNNPTFSELYKSFRSNNLSILESWFNAMYLRCYDNYYCSGVPVKKKYENIYAHPNAWFKNTHHMWRHNKWSLAVKILEIVPATGRFLHKLCSFPKFVRKILKKAFGNGHSIKRAFGTLITLAAVTATGLILGMWTGEYLENSKKIPAFELSINGVYVGDILNRTEAEEAKLYIEQTVSRNCKTAYNLDCEIVYTPTKINKGTNLTKAAVTHAFQQTAHEELCPGYGLYLYDNLLVVVEDRTWLDESRDEISLKYRTKEMISSDSVTTGADVGNNLYIKQGNYLKEQFSSYEDVRNMFSLSPDDGVPVTTDEIVPDNINVADKTAITLPGNSIGTATDVGSNDNADELQHIIPLKQTKTSIQTVQEEIPFEETVKYDDSLPETKRIVTKKGRPGLRIAIYQVVYDGENEVSREFVSETVIAEPSNQIVTRGTRPLSEEEQRTRSTGTYIWPSVGTITSDYSWRSWGSYNEFHKGIDFDDNNGTKIVASDGGLVIQARDRNDGYGLCILIEHDDGTRTRYAHCSVMHVNEGDRVAQNEHIGEIGATGWVTGSHLHFEIIKNGQTVNPRDYLQ